MGRYKKKLKYYINKIKRNSVGNIGRMAPQTRVHFQASQPGFEVHKVN
jgi:hypothetical protein